MNKQVWTLGDAVIDLLPIESRKYEACIGGAPVNVAVGLALLNQKSAFIGRIGHDAFGQMVLREISGLGVDTSCVELDMQRHTSTVLVSNDQYGERQFDFLVKSPADHYLTEMALPQFADDLLHICSLALVNEVCRHTTERAIAEVKRQGGLVSFDLNIRSQMWDDSTEMFDVVERFAERADILKLSEEEWYWLTKTTDSAEARVRLSRYPAALKIVTCGESGSMLFWQNGVYCYPGFSVHSIDTTGAGDAYMAGLLAFIAEQGMPNSAKQLSKMAEQASGCGALATTQKGALTALPNKQRLREFITTVIN